MNRLRKPTTTRSRLVLVLLLVLVLGTGNARPALAQTETSPNLNGAPADFTTCESLTEEELRAELNSLAQSIFARDDGIDLDAIVERQWQLLDMDRAVDIAVDDAVALVQRDDDLWNTFLSGWSPAKAEELASTVAAVAFDSETFRQALEALSEAIAADLETEIATLSAESVSANLICLQHFIERNYAGIVVDAFEQGIRDGAGDIDFSAGEGLDNGIMAVLSTHSTALGGVGVIVAAQLARKLVQRIGKTISQRVAGRVAGRLLGRAGATIIPLAGWIIGGGLIVYDVLDSLDGALPQIQQSLQSEDAKALIRTEIVQTLEPELQRELPQIARDVANELYAEWLDFRRQYRQLLALSEESPAFAALLDKSENLAKAALLLDAGLVTLGSDGVEETIGSGAFARLLAMPDGAVEILRVTGSVEAVLGWETLAGDALDDVVALDLHKLRMPQELDSETLSTLLAIGDQGVVAKLAPLDPAALASLFELSSATLNDLALQMSAADLEALGTLLDGLEPPRRNQFVSALLLHPNAMDLIVGNGAGKAVLASRDMAAAIAFLDTPADGYSIVRDGMDVAGGSVSLRLFGAKYGGWTTGLLIGIPLLLVLAIAYSLVSLIARPFAGIYNLFRRRRR